jgi:adenine-specific DNA-methyltransferase
MIEIDYEGEEHMIVTAQYMVDARSQRRGGIYYTPSLAATTIAFWAMRSDGDHILEPCFGSGVFLAAIKQVAMAKQFNGVHMHGVELMQEAHDMAIGVNLIESQYAICRDFLDIQPFFVDAVIGNPPYIRLRSLAKEQQERALAVTQAVLGISMDIAGSVWMAFVLHAVQFLKRGGRLAFVLPYEFTHVRYARPLWQFLSQNFGAIRIARVKERLFPDILQQAVVLFADDYGETTDAVHFDAYQTVQDFASDTPVFRKCLPLADIVNGGRPFLMALLPDALVGWLNTRFASLTAPVPISCVFNIGYVSGNKQFFHPDAAAIEEFDLPPTSLRNAFTSSRSMGGIGMRTSAIPDDELQKLFYPDTPLSLAEAQYIKQGEQDGVHLGYKCSRRTPWYRVPDVRVPDVILSVFGEMPVLLWNDGGFVASNSLLVGFMRLGYTTEQFMAAWYTSLTLLTCELHIHSLGGGMFILIPGEVASMRIPRSDCLPTQHLEDVDKALLQSKRNGLYEIGDVPVLHNALLLTTGEIDLIREGVSILAGWRKSAM